MKQEAIATENFDLAKKVKAELITRKTIDEKIVEKEKALNEAVTIEDYAKAEALQKDIEKLKTVKLKIEALKKEKETAILVEDYDKVIAIDNEIENLKSLKPKNDRPLSTEQEIDFLIAYYDQELKEFDKTNGKYAIFKGEQRTKMMDIFINAKNVYLKNKDRANRLTDVEEKGIHTGFMTTIKLSKDKETREKYKQYYLKRVNRNHPYTLKEKVGAQITYYENLLKSFPPETPQSSKDIFDNLITKNKDYSNRINSLTASEIMTIGIYFDTIPLDSDIPLTRERVNKYFKPIPGIN